MEWKGRRLNQVIERNGGGSAALQRNLAAWCFWRCPGTAVRPRLSAPFVHIKKTVRNLARVHVLIFFLTKRLCDSSCFPCHKTVDTSCKVRKGTTPCCVDRAFIGFSIESHGSGNTHILGTTVYGFRRVYVCGAEALEPASPRPHDGQLQPSGSMGPRGWT
nr:hypothetical protein CFP56_12282 [Quercus suber]